MALTQIEASSTVVNAIVEGYKDRTRPTTFLQGFFTQRFRPAKGVKFNVQRRGRPISVDVTRYSNGNRQKFSYSDQKLFVPPMFNDSVMLNDHELYMNVVGMVAAMNQGSVGSNEALLQANLQMFTREIMEQMDEVKDMQIRSIELMCAQALRTGIVQLKNSDNIDFKRKSASIVDLGGGNYWTTGTVNPFGTLADMCRFCRTEGNSGATEFNALVGIEALEALESNDIFIERMDLRNFNSGGLSIPSRPQEGAEWHGRLKCENFVVNIWTYDQYYDDPDTGTTTAYLNPKEVIMIPGDAEFTVEFCLVPQLIKNGSIPQTAEWLIQHFMDEDKGTDEMKIKCAPVPILKSVDRLATYQVVA